MKTAIPKFPENKTSGLPRNINDPSKDRINVTKTIINNFMFSPGWHYSFTLYCSQIDSFCQAFHNH